MTLKYQLISGSKLEFNLAPLEPALLLFHAIINECKNANLDLSIADDTTYMKLILQNQKAVFNLLSSNDIQEAILECSKKVLYNNQHFELSLFEKEENRRDFYPALLVIAMENIRPFFPEVLTYFQPIQNLCLKKM